MTTKYGPYNPIPGWIYRLESDWLMHETYPLAISRNDSRSLEYRWELWKCIDLFNGGLDDRILGYYPTCQDAMLALEEWKLLLYPYAIYKQQEIKKPSRWQRLGYCINRIWKRLG